MQREMIYYETPSGKRPFEQWLSRIKDETAKAIIYRDLQKLEKGLRGNCKPLGGNLQELKFHYGPGYRVYFAEFGNTVILLLSGGIKNTKKEQQQDIAQARKYLQEFLERD